MDQFRFSGLAVGTVPFLPSHLPGPLSLEILPKSWHTVEDKSPPALLMANLCCIQLRRVAMKHFPLVACHSVSFPRKFI